MPAHFTTAEKVQELRRELTLRRRVYPRRVEDGKLPQKTAARNIALIEALIADYEEKAVGERLL